MSKAIRTAPDARSGTGAPAESNGNGAHSMLSGSDMVIRSLAREGVSTIFGYPGGAIMPVYDAMLDHNLVHVLSRHEQGACHMADGYARASGKVGVCVATSGPGSTNLVTGGIGRRGVVSGSLSFVFVRATSVCGNQ